MLSDIITYEDEVQCEIPLKLHLGCGNQHINGYINIDCRRTKATDLICDISKLPYKDNTVSVIINCHLIEHIPVCLMANIESSCGEKYESIIELIKEWRRVLRTDGILIIEAPDFDEIVKEYVKADNKRKEEIIVYIYGGFRGGSIYDLHRWGVNEYRLRYILGKAGFEKITFRDAEDYHIDI